MELQHVRERLARYRPQMVGEPSDERTAVAVVLRPGPQGPEFLAIRRSERRGDPWSGHMAFPGGRHRPGDGDLFTTAARETQEEVGIDLMQAGEHLGRLDDLRAVTGGRRLNLVITPFVCALTTAVELSLDAREVQGALWVPLDTLRQPTSRGIHRQRMAGMSFEHEALVYRGHIIWGLTYRILRHLLHVLE